MNKLSERLGSMNSVDFGLDQDDISAAAKKLESENERLRLLVFELQSRLVKSQKLVVKLDALFADCNGVMFASENRYHEARALLVQWEVTMVVLSRDEKLALARRIYNSALRCYTERRAFNLMVRCALAADLEIEDCNQIRLEFAESKTQPDLRCA